MGVGESDAPMHDVSEAESPPQHEMRDSHEMDTGGTSEAKVDTVVLPEGVCVLDRPFVVLEKDPDGKKFDKVSRFICRCTNAALEMLLDVNVDVYPLKVGAALQVMVTTTLYYDGAAMPKAFTQALYKEQTLMDEFEYVCHGRVFKVKDAPDAKLQIFASFGGLIMRLIGDQNVLEKFQMDQNIYLLTRLSKISGTRKSHTTKRNVDMMQIS